MFDTVRVMRAEDEGLRLPQGTHHEQPTGHTRICWAAALGDARRGRPPEDWDISDGRARQLIADGFCMCTQKNKGGQSRASRNQAGGRGRGQWGRGSGQWG